MIIDRNWDLLIGYFITYYFWVIRYSHEGYIFSKLFGIIEVVLDFSGDITNRFFYLGIQVGA